MKTFSESTAAAAWLSASSHLLKQAEQRDYNVILEIQDPFGMTPADRLIMEGVDELLTASDQMSLATVRNTIFPADLYREAGSESFFEAYAKIYDRIRKHPDIKWGTYFGRMTMRDTSGKHGGNPLQFMVEKLKVQKDNPSPLHAAYELATVDVDSDLPIYNPSTDCRFTIGGPCLSHLSFKLRGDCISLTAVYRSHYYVRKALGNLIGLGWLMHYVAEQVGVKVGPLLCISTMAQIDAGKIKLRDIRTLVAKLEQQILAPI